MSDVRPTSHRRYRRRILGWGLLLLLVAFVVPAIFLVRWVQSDLGNRVPDALAAEGIVGVTADFSGQDGTLACAAPLPDPDTAVAAALDVYGVREIELDGSCTADPADDSGGAVGDERPVDSTADTTQSSVSVPDPRDTTGTTDDDVATTSVGTSSDSTSTTSTIRIRETIAELIAADPQFGQLASLFEQTGLGETLDDDGPFTLFAPTDDAFDAAFEAVGADAFEELTSDPDRLRAVLSHHVTEGALAIADLGAGELTMLDGSAIEVDPGGAAGLTLTSDDVVARAADSSQLDIDATNGFVHAIDQVLLPADGGAEPTATATTTDPGDAGDATTSVTLADGQLTFVGTVASAAQRDELLSAATGTVDAANVLDQLAVDGGAVVSEDGLGRLTRLLVAMPANLVSGTATLTGESLTLTGVHLGDDADAALRALGNELDADVSLQARTAADAGAAQALQDELNDFVRENPILFEPNSVGLTAEAGAVVEQVAARAQRFDGVTITIVGHTDTDGDVALNQLISDGRANTVLGELVTAGIDPDTLTAEGRGDTLPILGADGNEDKEASRRVEFVVEAQPGAG